MVINSRRETIKQTRNSGVPDKGHKERVNHQIKCEDIRLINEHGDNAGIVATKAALNHAREVGLDLIEISPNANPPVCKIMDYGKFRYDQQKRDSASAKNQKQTVIKEVKFRPVTDEHDYQVKLKSIMRFLSDGNKVKVTMRFRGREITHQDLGMDIMNRVISDVGDAGKPENKPRMDGRNMTMMMSVS